MGAFSLHQKKKIKKNCLKLVRYKHSAYICRNKNEKHLEIMKQSIREELLSHIEDCSKDFEQVSHFNMFNEDYYLIGYYNCTEWLKQHDIDVFEGVNICKDFERDNYGEVQTFWCQMDFDNYEKLVNNLVYWYGLELCNELGIELD